MKHFAASAMLALLALILPVAGHADVDPASVRAQIEHTGSQRATPRRARTECVTARYVILRKESVTKTLARTAPCSA